MTEQETIQVPKERDASHLPTLIPPASLLLQRIQTTVCLLHDVVLESSAEYWYGMGKKAYLSNQLGMAEAYLRSCLERDSDYWQANLCLALVWAKCQEISKAAEALQQAYEGKYPDASSFRNELSTSEWGALQTAFQYNQEDKLVNFKTQLSLFIIDAFLNESSLKRNKIGDLGARYPLPAWDSSSFQRICGWSIMYYEEEDFLNVAHLSFEHFARAIQCNPLHSHAYVEWGIAERRSGDSEKFIKFISHAITINPNCTRALFERGAFYSRAARAGGGEGFFVLYPTKNLCR